MGRSSVQESFMSQAEVQWVIMFWLNYITYFFLCDDSTASKDNSGFADSELVA
jgi:hypothetical protein